MTKILVTGGAGFIGSNLVDALIARGDEVTVVDNLSTGRKEYLNPQARFYNLDIASEKLGEIFAVQKFDYVFHLAAQISVGVSVTDPELDNRINVLGALNILKLCHLNQVKKIVFSSTGGAIYGDAEVIPTPETFSPEPISPYGIHKLTFEKYLHYYHKVFGQAYSILRFANVFGPRQYKGGEAGVVSVFVGNAVNRIHSTVNGDGLQTRDYVYVGDVVSALIKSLETDYVGPINIGTGIEKNLLDVIMAIELSLGRKIDRTHGAAKPGEQQRSCLDISLAKKVLDWEPSVNLEEGIKKTVEWSKNQLAA